jgi:hypothetical protein
VYHESLVFTCFCIDSLHRLSQQLHIIEVEGRLQLLNFSIGNSPFAIVLCCYCIIY